MKWWLVVWLVLGGREEALWVGEIGPFECVSRVECVVRCGVDRLDFVDIGLTVVPCGLGQ